MIPDVHRPILMVGIWTMQFRTSRSVSPLPVGRRRQGLRSLALPSHLGWLPFRRAPGPPPGENSAQTLRSRPAAAAPMADRSSRGGRPGPTPPVERAPRSGKVRRVAAPPSSWAGGSTLVVVHGRGLNHLATLIKEGDAADTTTTADTACPWRSLLPWPAATTNGAGVLAQRLPAIAAGWWWTRSLDRQTSQRDCGRRRSQ